MLKVKFPVVVMRQSFWFHTKWIHIPCVLYVRTYVCKSIVSHTQPQEMEDVTVLALVRDTDVPTAPTKEFMKWKWDLISSVLQVILEDLFLTLNPYFLVPTASVH